MEIDWVWGKGYYDKLLINFKKTTIGLGFNFQEVNKIYNQIWDVSLSAVLTPMNLFLYR